MMGTAEQVIANWYLNPDEPGEIVAITGHSGSGPDFVEQIKRKYQARWGLTPDEWNIWPVRSDQAGNGAGRVHTADILMGEVGVVLIEEPGSVREFFGQVNGLLKALGDVCWVR